MLARQLQIILILIIMRSFSWAGLRRKNIIQSKNAGSRKIWTRSTRSIVDSCPEKLEWKRTVFSDDGKTFRLELCCQVTKIWWSEILGDWRLNETAAALQGKIVP